MVVIAWMAIAGVVGPLNAKLTSVQENDNANFLPDDAEAQAFADEYAKFSEGTTRSLPALVLFTGEATPEKVGQANAFLATLASKKLVSKDGAAIDKVTDSIGAYLTAGVPLVAFPSQDGKAILANIPFDSDKIAATLANEKPALPVVVNSIRFYADEFGKSAGLAAYTTGFAAIFGDLFEAFGALDKNLLLITLLVVALILIVVYRSPILWILPLLSAVFAESLAGGVVYLLAKEDIITLDGQSQGILSVLVIGAATDYALLLIARYREELHHYDSRFDAMKKAWRGVVEPIIASGSTVTLGLLVLLVSLLSNNRSLGPVGAIGIVASMLTILTFLPCLLVLFGRWVFWPKVPRHDDADEKLTGFWSKVARATERSPRKYAIVTTVFLVALAAFLPTLKADGISTLDGFTKKPASLIGQEVLLQHFPGGEGQPTQILMSTEKAEQALNELGAIAGVSAVAYEVDQVTQAPRVLNGRTVLDLTLDAPADSNEARALVPTIREVVSKIDATALVGGTSAVFYDVDVASTRDRNVIIPIVLFLIALILGLLLRSILAAIVLLATVILSFVATLGASAIVFNHIFKFPGADTSFPLFAFIFLVALGIDYNIFLMTRVREETLRLGDTRAAVTKGVTVTGGVITSAGIVLAATFTVLGVLPLVALAEIAFAVAFGVLLDTLVVRSLLVPALVHMIDKKIWWPSQLAR